MKVAIIHYWLVGMRGGEKVVQELCKIYPQADIYTHAYNPKEISDTINKHNIKTTFIQNLPFAQKKYQSYLPFMPLALEQLDLRGYDLVISSESGPSKGVITDPNSLHLCYCHSPMRYIWDMYQDYFQNAGYIRKLLMVPLTHYLRTWDVSSSNRVDQFVANSSFIQKRIRKFYRREAQIIHPPVNTNDFSVSSENEDFYLMVGQLVDYKRTDLAVNAFNKLNKKLVIIGAGDQLKMLKSIAKNNVEILGYQKFDVIKDHYSKCKAVIFPGVEDFGMVPIEAMASGKPVIAYGKGGALDYVMNKKNGILFNEQTIQSLQEAIQRFEDEGIDFSPEEIKAFSEKFSAHEFRRKFIDLVEMKL